MKPRFTMTFSVATDESAERGDFARHGFLTRDGELPATRRYAYLPKRPAMFDLRRAVEILLARSGDGPVEADSCPISATHPPRWFTYGGGWNGDGESVQVSMHLPRGISGQPSENTSGIVPKSESLLTRPTTKINQNPPGGDAGQQRKVMR